MRLAFVLSALQAGGAERVVDLISKAAVARGWQVTIITFDRPCERVFHDYDPRVALLRLGIPAGVRGTAHRILALRQAFRAGQFDRVVSFLTKINVLALAAAVGLDIPLIVSERNNPSAQPMNPLWKVALSLLYARAAMIVMQTGRSLASLPRRHRLHACVIPNPVKLGSAAPRLETARQIVAVGRLTEQKGFDLLISAFAIAAREEPDWRLVIWGEGPARAQLEQQIAALGLKDRIRLAGLTAKPGEWTDGAEIFVLSSRYEGFPNAMLEAMAAGMPVIAFDCEFGPAELVRHLETGVLVENGKVEALGHSLIDLMRDTRKRRELGERARRSVFGFADQNVTERWLDCITACRGESASPERGTSCGAGLPESQPKNVTID